MNGQIEENISVSVRVRPLNERERKAGCKNAWTVQEKSNNIFLSPELFGKNAAVPQTFDNVFSEEQSTIDVYDSVAADVVSSVMSGINGTIFAYGQTASGKTFTMQGDQDHPGILPLAARQIFEGIAKMQHFQFLLHVSYIEVYNEQVKDLLSDSNTPLRIREDREKGFYVENVERVSIISVEELLEARNLGEIRRHVGVTNMNEKSSRSHTIFTIKVEMRENPSTNENADENDQQASNRRESEDYAFGVRVGQLNLVDLAGSENARNTGAAGERLKEGANINKSLLTLSRVISQLAGAKGKNSFINFRDSKLTQILQPSLGGNCRTAVVCCVTPASQFLEETKSTLNFAGRAKQIRTVAVVNEILDEEAEMKKLKRTIESLKKELASQQAANVEKDQLEARLKKLTNLMIRGGDSTDIFSVGSEVLQASTSSQEKKRKKKKYRETWCPGGLLPAPAELGLATFDTNSMERSASAGNIEASDLQSPAVVKKRRSYSSALDGSASKLDAVQSSSEPCSTEETSDSELVKGLEMRCAELEVELKSKEEELALESEELKTVSELLRLEQEQSAMKDNESETKHSELSTKLGESEAQVSFLQNELEATRELVATREDELLKLRKAIEAKVAEHGDSVQAIHADISSERETFQSQVDDLKLKLQESFTAVANTEKSREDETQKHLQVIEELRASQEELTEKLEDARASLATTTSELQAQQEENTKLQAAQTAELQTVGTPEGDAAVAELQAENARLTEEVQQLGDALIQNELRLERAEQQNQADEDAKITSSETELKASEEVEALRQRLHELRQETMLNNENFQSEILVLEEAKAASQAMVEKLEGALQEVRANALQEVNLLQEKLDLAENSAVEEAVSEMISSVERIQHIEKLNGDHASQVDHFVDRLAVMQVNEATLLEKLERLESEMSNGVAIGIENNCLKKEVYELEQDKDEIKANLDRVTDEKQELMTLYNENKGALADLRSEFSVVSQELEALKASNSSLQEATEDNLSAEVSMVMNNTISNILENSCSELEAQVATLSGNLDTLESTNVESVEVITKLESELEESKAQSGGQAELVLEMRSKVTLLEEQVSNVTHQLHAVETDAESFQEEIQRLCISHSQLDCEREVLEASLAAEVEKATALEQQLSSAQVGQVDEMNRRICQLNLEIEVLNEELETTRALAEVAQKTSETQMTSLLGNEGQLQQQQTRIRQLEQMNDLAKQELEKARAAQDSLKQEYEEAIRAAELEQTEFLKQSEGMQLQHGQVLEQLQEERSKSSSLEVKLANIATRMAEMEQQNESLAVEASVSKAAGMDESNNELVVAKETIEKLTVDRDNMSRKIVERDAEIAELSSRYQRTQKQLETINSELVSQEEAMHNLVAEHEETLKALALKSEESEQALKKRVDELTQSLSEASVAVTEKEVQLGNTQEELSALKAEGMKLLNHSKSEVTAVKNEFETYEKQAKGELNAMKLEKEELESRLELIQDVQQVESELRTRVQQLTVELEQEKLKNTNNAASSSVTATGELNHQIESLERQILSKDKRIAKLEKCKMTGEIVQLMLKLKKDNKSYKSSLAEARGQNEIYDLKLQEEKEKVKNLKKKLISVGGSVSRNSDREDDNIRLIETLDREVNDHREQQARLDAYVTKVAKKFGVMESTKPKALVDMLLGRLETLQQERDAFEAELADAVQFSRDLQEALEKNEELEKKLVTMSKELDAQRDLHHSDSSGMKTKVAQLTKELENLQKELSSAQDILRERDAHESKQLVEKEEECAALKQQLEEKTMEVKKAEAKSAEHEQNNSMQVKQLQDSIRFLEKENLDILKKLRKTEESYTLLQTRSSIPMTATTRTPSVASKNKRARTDSENVDPQTKQAVSAKKVPRPEDQSKHPMTTSSTDDGPGECQTQ